MDDYLIAGMEQVTLTMHKPEAQDVALVCDAPWEGNTSAYFTLFQDGEIFRAYYRGTHHDEAANKGSHRETACYAESRDGITWVKPKLGLVEFGGSKENNIILIGEGCTNFAPFKDADPDCPPASRYKALASTCNNTTRKKKPSLQAYQSADGLRWSRMREEPVITAGSFDSQNTAFYDTARGEYRAYWRYFTGGYTDERGWKPAGVRAIRTATSKDFLHWENQADLQYGDAPPAQLYTNAVRPYARAAPAHRLSHPLSTEARASGACAHDQPRRRELQTLGGAIDPHHRAERSRRQSQQLHDERRAAIARQRPRVVRLCHRSLFPRPRQPRAPLHVSRGWFCLRARRRRRLARHQGADLYRHEAAARWRKS